MLVWNYIYINIWTRLNNIWTIVKSIFNQVWTTIWSIMNRIYNEVIKPITDKITGAWNNMKSSLASAAQFIYDHTWGPISQLYDKLRGFWFWIRNPFGGGNAGGASGGGGGAFAGYPENNKLSYQWNQEGNYAGGGFFGGVLERAFNITHAISGRDPQHYAGGGGSGYAGRMPILEDLVRGMATPCSSHPDNCPLNMVNNGYAGGWDVGQKWTDNLLDLIYAWQMNIFGHSFDLRTLSQGGDMSLYEAILTALIAGTRYDFYYDGRYSNAEALRRGAFNCVDGAEIAIALAQAMGLSAHMQSGTWKNTGIGHVWAVINGRPFDTTSFQNCGVWGPSCSAAGGYAGGFLDGFPSILPSIPRSVSSRSAGPAPVTKLFKFEFHIEFNNVGNRAELEAAAEEIFEEKIREIFNPDV